MQRRRRCPCQHREEGPEGLVRADGLFLGCGAGCDFNTGSPLELAMENAAAAPIDGAKNGGTVAWIE